jgi:hypothetical protein
MPTLSPSPAKNGSVRRNRIPMTGAIRMNGVSRFSGRNDRMV